MKQHFRTNPAFANLQPSSTLYVNETVNQLWQQGETVFHMGFGESRFNVHPKLQDALQKHADKKSYLPAKGLPQLTSAVAEYYSAKLKQNYQQSQVIIGPGSKSLIYGLQMILDADVFLPTPSWVSYAPQARLLHNRYKYIPSKVEDNYQLDIDELDVLVQNSGNPCKLLVINSPNNPTGEVWSEQFLNELADYCRRNKILVLSDEIYFQVVYGDQQHVSISQFYPEGTFVLGGLSKHLSIGGWRVGVALLPNTDLGKELMKKLVIFSSETWSGVSAPIQYAAVLAYQEDSEIEQYISDCASIHGIRTHYIRDELTKLGIRCTGGHGAFYLTANFDRFTQGLSAQGVKTSIELSRYLLDRFNIATLPGVDFGIPEETLSLRLSTSYIDMEKEDDSDRLYQLFLSNMDEQEFMSETHHPNTHAALMFYKKCIAALS